MRPHGVRAHMIPMGVSAVTQILSGGSYCALTTSVPAPLFAVR